MARRSAIQPTVGDWFSRVNQHGDTGERFEVVAFDEDEGAIEIQYFDGTLEEMDVEEWNALAADGALRISQPPEDYSGSIDTEHDDDLPASDDSVSQYGRALHAGAYADGYDLNSGVRASALDGLDLFE